jgi:Phosphotransferase enzyme family
VAGVTVLDRKATIAGKVIIGLTYDQPGEPAAPASLCIKGYFGEADTYAMAGTPEAHFYRELQYEVGTRVPVCHYVGFDETTGRSLLLLENLAVPGTELRTALTPFSPAESAAALDQLAVLHATRADAATLAQEWLAPRMGPMAGRVPAERLQELLDRRRGEGLPDQVRNGRRVNDGMRVLGETLPADLCLLHGDTHAGNWFLRDDGAGLFDWQLVQRGSWALDVSYHLGSVLETEVRREHEGALLEGYLDRRDALGAPVTDRDGAWDAYRRSLAYGYFLWAMTQFTDEDITTVTVRRLGHALADHDTFGLLGV